MAFAIQNCVYGYKIMPKSKLYEKIVTWYYVHCYS